MNKETILLCGDTGKPCENPTMVKGTDLCNCDSRHLNTKTAKMTQVENLTGLDVFQVAYAKKMISMYKDAGKQPNYRKIRSVLNTHYPESEVEPVDLFHVPDLLPKEVRAITHNFNEATYNECNRILLLLKPLGYTFDYYLDAIPYNLRKI